MPPVRPPEHGQEMPRARLQIPAENSLRREVKTFLATMSRQLDEVERGEPDLPAMREWQRTTLEAVRKKGADIHAILQQTLPFLQERLRDPLQMELFFDRFVPGQLPESAAFQEMALRRKCNYFVRDLGLLFQALEGQELDSLTLEIKELYALFVQALSLQQGDTAGLLNTFVPLLQGALVDSTGFKHPLEEYSLLGSDGHTYGMMFLTLYYHKAPAHVHCFPPHAFDAAPTFSAEDIHPVVKSVIQWLGTLEWQNGTAKPAEIFKAQYEALIAQEPEAYLLIPTRQDVEDRLKRERIEAQERAEMQAHAALDARFQAILNHPIQQAINGLQVQFQEIQAADHAGIENLHEHFRVQFEAAHHVQAVLGQQAAMLSERVELLKKEYDRLDDAVGQAERSIAQLNVAIAEVAAAQAKRKEEAFGSILKAVAIMGVCIFASWAISMAIQAAMGVSAGAVGAAGAAGAGSGAAGAGVGIGGGYASAGAGGFGVNAAGAKALITPIRAGFQVGLVVPW